jgi:flagellar basal-body rod protein FlgC
MSFLSSLDISASALTAQRLRMDVISENIANSNTTRTASGEPYRRRMVMFSQRGSTPFSSYFEDAKSALAGGGVYVSQIVEDDSPFKLDYNPEHPDADEDGYVRLPNVDEVTEMIDMMSATRSYEANVTALNATKGMAMKALEIGR